MRFEAKEAVVFLVVAERYLLKSLAQKNLDYMWWYLISN